MCKLQYLKDKNVLINVQTSIINIIEVELFNLNLKLVYQTSTLMYPHH